MSAVLFSVIIEWVLCTTTKGKRRGRCRRLSTVLEELNYADGIALLLHSPNTMQEKNKILDRSDNCFASSVQNQPEEDRGQ